MVEKNCLNFKQLRLMVAKNIQICEENSLLIHGRTVGHTDSPQEK